MALLFIDGFDHYATADATKKWSATQTLTIGTTGRRSGKGASGTATLYLLKNLSTGYSTLIVGFAFKQDGTMTGQVISSLYDAGTGQVHITANNDGSMTFKRGSTTVATSASAILTVGTYYYIEWKVTIHDTTGAYEVRVNGVNVLSATNVDTKNTSNATANQVYLWGSVPGNDTYFDDVYICDNSGSAPQNDFLGDCRVDTLLPTADGTYTSWTPSTGTDHYALVDETTPNTTDYNSTATATNKDSYAMQDLSTLTGTIYGVQTSIAALKDDAGARSLKVGVRSSSTDSLTTGAALSTAQLYYSKINETDPSTAAAWTESGVNAAQALVECV